MSPVALTKEFYLPALRREGAAFRAAVSAGTLDRPVPTCPEWDVEALVGHLGHVYERQRTRWERGVTTRPERADQQPAPTGAAVLDWWQEQFDATVTSLATLAPDAPAWNWGMLDPTGIFWHRRMTQETSVHRWDAQVAVGLPEPVDPSLAADGVDEVLDTFLPGGFRRGPTDRTGVVRLQARDAEQAWVVRVRGEGLSVLDTDTVFDDAPDANVTATGTASDVLLALWGRVPFDVLTVEGPEELLASLRVG